MQTATRVAQPARYWRQSLGWLAGERGILTPLLFLAPFLVFFGVFLLYPIGYGFYISLTEWDLLTDPQWVGLDNYRRLLDDALFEKSVRNTVFFVVLNVPLVVVIPLLLAVLVDHPIFGRGVFRSIFTTPLMMSVTTVGILWVWFLNPTFGLINYYLGKLGIPGQYWLNEEHWSLVAVVVASVWWGTGFNMVLFLAGLQDIPEELYDAAKVDGAGAWSLAAVDTVMTGRVDATYALVRPPGHHAMADKGMGFCVFNNAVVAARHAQRAHGVGRVLILDWDVHHGNGTQDAFYADPKVLFVSLHQDDHYPVGWGAVDQTGEGEGEGFTVNIPLPPGTGWRGYEEAFVRIIQPVTRRFGPELIIISAGQDASVMDPLARMALTTDSYRAMTAMMLELADELCDGRLVMTQEGGYAPTYAPYCSAAIAETLVGPEEGVTPVPEPYGERARLMPPARALGFDAAQAIEDAAASVARYWRLD